MGGWGGVGDTSNSGHRSEYKSVIEDLFLQSLEAVIMGNYSIQLFLALFDKN